MKLEKNNKLILDLGKQPVTNQFSKKHNKKSKKYNLKLVQDLNTGIIKIEKPFPFKSLTPKVKWIQYNEPEGHIKDLFNTIYKKHLKKNDKVLGLTYKDNSLIQKFKNNKIEANLLDPISDLGLNKNEGIETVQHKLDQSIINKILKKYGKQDIVIIRHIWEHVYNLNKFTSLIKQLVNEEGLFLFEVPDNSKLLKNSDYTMIWEEHLFYFNKYTFLNSLRQYDFFIKYTKKIIYPNEDVLIALVNCKKNVDQYKSKSELNKIIYLANNFKKNFNFQKKNIHKKIVKISKHSKKVILYGAGHLGISFILYFNLEKYISLIVDDNLVKHNYYIPGAKIKILHSSKIKLSNDNHILISANQINENFMINKLINNNVSKSNIDSIFSTSKIFIGR